jgi:hypothetical protein
MAQKLFLLVPPPGSAIPKYVTTVDANGASVFSDGIPSRPPTAPCLPISSTIDLADRLLTSGNELVLSERAVSVLTSHRMDSRLIRCPVTITSKEVQTDNWPAFQLWYSCGRHDVLHKDARTRTIKGHVLSVFDWVIDSSVIPPFDLFLAPTNSWIATERLVDAIFDARLSGFGFAAIPCLGQ